MATPGKIFISYRREDSATITGRMYDWLTQRVPKTDIFFDVDLEYGVDFVQRIQKTIGQCKVMLVVIGPHWIGEDGSLSDYVVMEVELALRQGVTIIPVLVNETKMPAMEKLPPTLQALTTRNAATVRDGRDFPRDMEDLARNMAATLGPPLAARLTAKRPAGAGTSRILLSVTAVVALLGIGVGVLSQTPADPSNPVWGALHSSVATATLSPTVTPSPTATATVVPAQYTIGYVTNSIRTTTTSLQAVTANCGVVGQRIGGGFRLLAPLAGTSTAFWATASYPTGTDGWTVGTKSAQAVGVTLIAYAVCLKTNFPLGVQVVTQPTNSSVTTACGSGVVLSGGMDGLGVLIKSYPSDGKTWQSESEFGASTTHYAVCSTSGLSAGSIVNQSIVTGQGANSASVFCPSGQLLVGGGFQSSGAVMEGNFPPQPNFAQWSVTPSFTTPKGTTVTAFGVCVIPPAHA